MEIIATPREWGNSLGITLPKDVIEQSGIKKGEPIIINIRKKNDISGIKGLVKFKRSAQELKDEMRKGWD